MKVIILTICLLLCSDVFAQGQSAEHRTYGVGHPKTTQDLPPGQLRKDLEALTPRARGKALKQLQSQSFPEQDLETLRVSPDGGILYVDPPVTDTTESTPALPIDPDQVFLQHSRPGSTNVVFIDFDGMTITNTAWNKNADVHVAMPFDPSGNGPEFTAEELSRIYHIWQRVSEDYRPFELDVTTEEPATFTPTTGRILVTRSTDENGICIYYCSPGGIAYFNVFGLADYVSYWSPALVFWDNMSGGTASYSSEASSHEFGHNVGLSHDGIINPDGTVYSYYRGHGTGLTSWAPIMGASYYNNVTHWSKGEYTGANNTQDDLAIINRALGYAPDEDGVIVNSGDVDSQIIDVTGAGLLEATITPIWGAYESPMVERRGSNLDIQATLVDPTGVRVVFDNPTDTKVDITADVGVGQYTLEITGVGSVNYSDYDSMGSYLVDYTITPDDPNPPDPCGDGVCAADETFETCPADCPPPPPPDNDPPQAVIDYSPAVLEYYRGKGIEVTFDASGSTDPDGVIVAYVWSIDGMAVNTKEVFTTTLKKGIYVISLQAIDDDGAIGLAGRKITVEQLHGKP
jgi:hypothetical protein